MDGKVPAADTGWCGGQRKCRDRTAEVVLVQKLLPHLLFDGPPGTGKTSTIWACAREMYGASARDMVLEINASDNGIGTARDVVSAFARTSQAQCDGRGRTPDA